MTIDISTGLAEGSKRSRF